MGITKQDEIRDIKRKLSRLSMLIDHVQTQPPYTRKVKMPIGWVDEIINPADSIPVYRKTVKRLEQRLAELTNK